MTIKCILALFGYTCLLSLALGCAEIKEFYHGNTISSVPVMVLQEGTPNAGRWETFDLIIEYVMCQHFSGHKVTQLLSSSQRPVGPHIR